MRIHVHTNLYVMGFEDRTFLEFPDETNVTLRQLLQELSGISRDNINFLTGIREDFRFFVNQQEVLPTEEGFRTSLKDGDMVDVMLETLGG